MKAFPHHHVTTYDYDNRHTNGMDLRDYFAARAMQTLLQIDPEDWHKRLYPGEYTTMLEGVADVAFNMADAMMKRRESKV